MTTMPRKPRNPDLEACENCRSFSRSNFLTTHDYKKRTGWCMRRRISTKEDSVCPFFKSSQRGRFELVAGE